jgi:hypothetical protein
MKFKLIPQEDLTFPPDYRFQLPDGSQVPGDVFRDCFAGVPGTYPVWRGPKRIGTFTNHGPISQYPSEDEILRKLGLE